MASSSQGSGKQLTVCLAAAGIATATGVVLWLTWPRRKAPRDRVLAALGELRHELAAAYADVVGSISSAGFAPGARRGSEDPLDKLRQAVEQPLVLQAALGEAATSAAGALREGATAQQLEAETQRLADDPEVKEGTGVARTLHQECVAGRLADVAESGAAAELWGQEALLSMLRQLGEAKAETIRELRNRGKLTAAASIRACSTSEDQVWSAKWPEKAACTQRRRCFTTALERHSSTDVSPSAYREGWRARWCASGIPRTSLLAGRSLCE
eukprot:TRINITY_DN18607_c0_g1_i2.p1 TRINITY_DN18607_c0_g1~~TRINITY_DN18607_c0_g1_i2.p1  ORF type:complete len:295 (+),score=59.16 TRINITY_DN18607_c0_g1_i2:75-887(+)